MEFSSPTYDNFAVPFDKLSPAQQMVRAERQREELLDKAAYEAALAIADSLTTESSMKPKDFIRQIMDEASVTAQVATAVFLELSSRQIITYTLGHGISRVAVLNSQ